MSLLLAFDLSTPRGSVALGDSGRILGETLLLSEKRQGVELVPAIDSLLAGSSVAPRDLQGIVVGRGPGSFTGVRIAAATARGMAAALDLPLWAPSSLAAGAANWGEDGADEPRYVLFDARGDRVYAACYRRLNRSGGEGGKGGEDDGGGRDDEESGRSRDSGDVAGEMWVAGSPGGGAAGQRALFETVVAPIASTVREVLDSDVPSAARFAGDGALRHAEVIREMGYEVLPNPLGIPSARGLLHLVHFGALPPEEAGSRWEPDYIRGSSAIPLSDR